MLYLTYPEYFVHCLTTLRQLTCINGSMNVMDPIGSNLKFVFHCLVLTNYKATVTSKKNWTHFRHFAQMYIQSLDYVKAQNFLMCTY